MFRLTLPLLIVFIAFLGTRPVRAQAFGQWRWTGMVGVGQRTFDRTVGEAGASESEQTDIRAAAAIHGFLGHPALGSFTAGLDVLDSSRGSGGAIDDRQVGYSLSLDVLPRGAYRLDLYGRRRNFDRSAPNRGVLTDRRTAWGGRFRIARGALRGLVLGADEARTSYFDPELDEGSSRFQLIEWTRAGRISHDLHLERRVESFGVAGQETEQVSASLNQKGDLSKTWRWTQSAVAVTRDSRQSDGSTLTADDYRLVEIFDHTVRGRDLLEIQARASRTKPPSGVESDSQGLSTTYQWRPRPSIGVGPFVAYAVQSSDVLERDARRAGLSAYYTRSQGLLDTLLTARASYDAVEIDDSMETREETATSASLTGALAHGTSAGLRKEIEVELGRNELRLDRDIASDVSEIVLPRSGLDTEDTRRARFSLKHAWDSRSIGGYTEWRQSQGSAGPEGSETYDTTSVTGTLYFNAARFSLGLSATDTDVENGGAGDQTVRRIGGTARWRPWRPLDLRASYGLTERDVLIAPDLESERLEVAATLRIGLFDFELAAFDMTEEFMGSPERTSEGITWSVRRRFGGYLPVVTGTQRRGVIR